MATQTTGGGSTTSFTKTPQAGDDCFDGYGEDVLGIVFLDVMQNDLGGKAKILWALDDGQNDSGLMSGYEAADLLAQDLARMESCSTDTSENGARIWITTDGKVGYDAGTLSAGFRSELNSLAVGEVGYDSFIYSIRLANGTLSWARAYIQFTGTNDAPTVSASENGAVVEDADDPTLSDTGTITFDDVDLTDTHSIDPVTASASNTLGGTLIASITDSATGAGSGTVTWTYEVANSATQYLGAGQTATESFTVRIRDNNGGFVDQLITVTVTGTNDNPTISTAVDSGTVAEDGITAASGTIDFSDIDLVDIHTLDVDPGDTGYLGTFTADVNDPSTGDGSGQVTWNFTVDNADLQHLPKDAVVTQTYTVIIDDGKGGTVSQLVTITVTGVNDAPVAVDDTGAGNEDSLISGSVAGNDTDVDDGAARTFSANNNPAGFSMSADGSWSLDATNAAYQHLAAGATTDVVVNYTVDDGLGGTDTGQLTITVTGVNDAAAIGGTDSGEVTEDGILLASGILTVDDVDGADTFVAQTVTNAYGTFTLEEDGDWTF